MSLHEVFINDVRVPYEVEGSTKVGREEVLLAQDDDLTQKCSWHKKGYTILPFLRQQQFQQLSEGLLQLFAGIVAENTSIDLDQFNPAHYHRHVDDAAHARIISQTRQCFSLDQLPIPPEIIWERISEVLRIAVSSTNPRGVDPVFCLRIVRPGAMSDNNPPHKDIYLDRLRDGINIYVPLIGSNERSSLPILPGSHLLPEKLIERTESGSKINGLPFTVPCITTLKGEPVRMVRPNPGRNEMLLFSPYLVHGGGYNLNDDMTRISLEMRFFREF
ncbi:MAG: hypothetical protein AAGI38_13500 [Bacteroidota bacterium]